MTTGEKRQETAENMAMWLVFRFGYRAGMVFKERYGPEAEKMFIGGQQDEGDSGKSHLYTRPLSNTDYKEIPRLFQRISEMARQNLEKYEGQEEQEAMALRDTESAHYGDPYVNQLLFSENPSN